MPPIPYDPKREALYTPERRPTLFTTGADPSPTLLALEAARLAYLRAETSAAEHERLRDALACVGFGPPELFVDRAFDSGTFGFGARRAADGCTLLAFRGTQPDDPRDLETDLRFPPVRWPETGGHVHHGFAVAARSVLPVVKEWLRRAPGTPPSGAGATPLVLAGHSLGAAIATVAATVLRPTLLVTIGSPRVGDADFAHALADIPGPRIVDCADLVTRVPPPEMGYAHVRSPTYITAAGEVLDAPADETIATDMRHAKAEYLFRHAWKPGNVLLRSLADHAPINYLRAFFR